MTNFMKLIQSIEIPEMEHRYLACICSEWALFNTALSQMNKTRVMGLLKYIVEERPQSNRLLDRCIGRFNRLNSLKKEDVICLRDKLKNTSSTKCEKSCTE